MSICGNCPYPIERNNKEDVCGWGCSHEDAAYRAQWVYERLTERYEELEHEYEHLKAENLSLKKQLEIMEDDGK